MTDGGSSQNYHKVNIEVILDEEVYTQGEPTHAQDSEDQCEQAIEVL